MKHWLRITTIFSLILIYFFDQEAFSQPFSLANIPQHAASFSVSPNCNVTITSSGDGTQQWQGSAIAANGLGGTAGAVAQNCANQTGLRLEMIGAGNSSGTLAWNNSITVVFTFPQGVKGPVTFNIYDLTEPLYNDGTFNYAYYQDKVTISAARCDGVIVTPNLTTNNGPISSAAVGSSMGLTAIRTQGQCLNEPISISSAFDVIKTITIVYSNQDPPTNVTAPVGTPARYGISQYQYIFIGNINAIAPSPINVTATPNTICAGQTSTLNASSTGAYTYSWAPGTIPANGASVAATPPTTTIYTVSGSSGTCIQTNTVSVTVNPSTVPTFNAMGPYCVGATPGSLPTTSTNGINGTWSPAVISTATAGTSVYNFTPTAGACATATTMSITISSGFTPTFTALGPYCVGAVAGALPTTSNNGIAGSWSPSAISTATAGTSVYSFTPNAGQCGVNTTMNVTVNANVAPTFTALGPYCMGASPGTLPTTSTNGISGTWNPANISTASAGTTVYTFTPTAGQCATSTAMSVTVNPNVSPSFAALGPYCIGAVPNVLQGTSINGISGSWNPSSINTASTGTTIYTFTPNAGQCSATATMNVTVNPNAIPSFYPLGPYCVGAVPATLPANSTNGISGTWNPATISTASAGTTVYTFTPSAGQCASSTTLSITVNANIAPTFAAIGPYCVGAVPGVLPTTSTNGVGGTWNPVAISTAAAGTTVYTFTHSLGQCATNTTLSVTVNAATLPTFAAFGPYCIGAVPGTLPTTSTNGINGTWSPTTISTATAGTTVYTFTPATGQCASTTTR
ncbi:MAG: gliding motility-associated C-terminal domain-containing protein, partial [Bacteroidota bacterium]